MWGVFDYTYPFSNNDILTKMNVSLVSGKPSQSNPPQVLNFKSIIYIQMIFMFTLTSEASPSYISKATDKIDIMIQCGAIDWFLGMVLDGKGSSGVL